MKLNRLVAALLLAVIMVGMVPSALAVKWKEPWEFAETDYSYYPESWVKHFATRKNISLSTKTTAYRVRKYAYNEETKLFEKVTRLRARWEPRAYELNAARKQIIRVFDRKNRLGYTLSDIKKAKYPLVYYKSGATLQIAGQTNVNKRWYLVNIRTSATPTNGRKNYNEGSFCWVFSRYIVKANKSGEFYLKARKNTSVLKTASASGKVMATIKKGTELTPTYKCKKADGYIWYEVNYYGSKYWIRQDTVYVKEY